MAQFGELRSLLHASSLSARAVRAWMIEHDLDDRHLRYIRDHLARRTDGEPRWRWVPEAPHEAMYVGEPGVGAILYDELWEHPLGPPPLRPRAKQRRALIECIEAWDALGLVRWRADASGVLHRWSEQRARAMLEEYDMGDERLWGALEDKARWRDGRLDAAGLEAAAARCDFAVRAPFDYQQPVVDACRALCQPEPWPCALAVAWYVWEPSRSFGDGAHSEWEWRRLGTSLGEALLEMAYRELSTPR